MRLVMRCSTAGAETHYERSAAGFPSVTWDAEAGCLHLSWGNAWSEGFALRLTLNAAEAREMWLRFRQEYLWLGRARAATAEAVREHNRRVDAEQVARHNASLYAPRKRAGNDCSGPAVGS